MNQTRALAAELAALVRRRRPDLTIEVAPIGDHDWVVHLPGLSAGQIAAVLADAEADRRALADAIRHPLRLR